MGTSALGCTANNVIQLVFQLVLLPNQAVSTKAPVRPKHHQGCGTHELAREDTQNYVGSEHPCKFSPFLTSYTPRVRKVFAFKQ